MLKLLHTSDVQLGASFGFLGEQGTRHRRQLEQTFAKIVQLAHDDKYDMLLIAGDLFDGNAIPQGIIDFVVRTLGSTSVPVCILPGNHDALTERSIYRRTKFPPNVHILSDSPTYLDFPDLDLMVAGTPLLNSHDTDSSLKGVLRTDQRRWFVAMAHGSMQIPGFIDGKSRPIRPEEIAATKADYVALGDWHSLGDQSQGSVKAWYCGAPEPTGLSQSGAGKVLRVILDQNGTTVTPISVGAVKIRTVSIDVAGMEQNQLIEQINAVANLDTMLTVKIGGLRAIDTFLDLEAIEKIVAPNCYWLKIEDTSITALESISPDDYPDNRVIGRYVRLMAQQVEQAIDDRSRRIAEQALQIGVALLQGKEVLK